MFKHRDATKHGIDIAKGRVDDLDKEVIRFALGYKGKKVAVDLGAGQSRLAAILVLLGWEVWVYDINDNSKYFATLGELSSAGEKVVCKQVDLNNLDSDDLPKDIVIAISQRALHHLPNKSAKEVLEKVYNKMIVGGKLFVSLSSIESKLAAGYECADSPVGERFCRVGEEGQTTYSIKGDVCLYNEEEVQSLIEENKFMINKLYKSDFGNIKIIATK